MPSGDVMVKGEEVDFLHHNHMALLPSSLQQIGLSELLGNSLEVEMVEVVVEAAAGMMNAFGSLEKYAACRQMVHGTCY